MQKLELNNREKEFISLILCGHSQTTIAESYGISKTRVSDIVRKAKHKILLAWGDNEI